MKKTYTNINNGNVQTVTESVQDVQDVQTVTESVQDVQDAQTATETATGLVLAKGDNIVYDLNGKATAPLTLSNAFTAMDVLTRSNNRNDFTKGILLATILETVSTDKKTLAETKKTLAENYGYGSTNAVDKVYRAVTTFMSVDSKNLLALKENETAKDVISNNGKSYEMVVNNRCVKTLTDKFGFEFSISALQELLWLKDENGNVDVDKITSLIADGKLLASMPSSSKTKTSIRSVVNENKINANKDGNDNDSNGNTNGNSNGNAIDTDKKTVEYNEASDKSKAVAIQTIMNSISDEKFTNSKFVTEFNEFLTQFIANMK